MDDHVTSKRDVPNAPFYVTMTDNFMSGWGMAKDKTNKLCFVCEDITQVSVVMRNALARGDMSYVYMGSTKPRVFQAWQYWQVKTINDYPRFYKA